MCSHIYARVYVCVSQCVYIHTYKCTESPLRQFYEILLFVTIYRCLNQVLLLSFLKLNYPQNMHLLSAIENANNAFRMVFKKSNYII